MGAWAGIDEFVAVCDRGSFSQAARALNLSTSHVSRAVAGLEARVQARLFYRTTRRVSLTEAGRAFAERCRGMIQERDEAVASMSEAGEPQGRVRLTCSTAFGERFVAPLLVQFLARYPRVTVAMELTNTIVDLVGEGMDLAIRTGTMKDSRLVRSRVSTRRLYLCAAPDYVMTRGQPLSVADLRLHDCLIGTADQWRFAERGQPSGFRPHGRFRCNSGYAVVDAALRGLGICQLPEFYVLPHLASGTLVPLLEPFRPEDEGVWAVHPDRQHLPPKVRLLIAALRQGLDLPLAP